MADHIGSTLTRLAPDSPWRLVVHWHEQEGEVVPAGIEVRCYGVPGDDELDPDGGQSHPDQEHPVYASGERARAVVGDLVAKRVRWGAVLAEHAGKFADWFTDGADDPEPLHRPSVAAFRELAEAAGRLEIRDPLKGQRRDELVMSLLAEAKRSEDRSRVALGVLRRLRDRHHFHLDEASPQDRQKVQQWIYRARQRQRKEDK